MTLEATKDATPLWVRVAAWLVAASSILWLAAVWNQYVESAADRRTFAITVLVCLPLWISQRILVSREGRFSRVGEILAALIIYPPVIVRFVVYFADFRNPALNSLDIVMFTAWFGVLWEFARRLPEFRFVLWRD